ncbi:DUF2637 domain-containing protein [Streptomyces sp. NBC_00631]|uniref:DUF2637 domain-containing protein n=1 Tax=Streptomyces sp. NBC_00631 TaxID=2975793 RepID=UPI0030DF1046
MSLRLDADAGPWLVLELVVGGRNSSTSSKNISVAGLPSRSASRSISVGQPRAEWRPKRAAWRRLRTGTTKAAAWCWCVIALVASLGANVATAGLLDLGNVPAWLRILVAGWPAVAFLGGTLLAHSAPKAETNEIGADLIEDQEHEPEATPDPPPAPPAIEALPECPPVPVPTALVDHARKVAAEHHTRTGTPIDTPTLRARLGVPAPMAEAIAAQL